MCWFGDLMGFAVCIWRNCIIYEVFSRYTFYFTDPYQLQMLPTQFILAVLSEKSTFDKKEQVITVTAVHTSEVPFNKWVKTKSINNF